MNHSFAAFDFTGTLDRERLTLDRRNNRLFISIVVTVAVFTINALNILPARFRESLSACHPCHGISRRLVDVKYFRSVEGKHDSRKPVTVSSTPPLSLPLSFLFPFQALCFVNARSMPLRGSAQGFSGTMRRGSPIFVACRCPGKHTGGPRQWEKNREIGDPIIIRVQRATRPSMTQY